MAKQSESIFHKVIEKRSKSGDFQGQVIVDLSPWAVTNEKTGEKAHGHTLRIRVDKMPYGERKGGSSFVNINPSDKDVRQAILDAFEKFDAIKE